VSLTRDLLAAVTDSPALVIQRVEAGARFFGVRLDEAAGIAFLGAHQRPSPEEVEAAAIRARERPALEVARWLDGDSATDRQRVQTAIGAAALNALLAHGITQEQPALGQENGLDLIAKHGEGKRLAIVGHFPYLDTLRAKAMQSWVLELDPEDGDTPAGEAPTVLPQADVVGITGSALANGTLEGMLLLCRRDAFVVLIGPTTPLSPVLFDYGVDALCGVIAEDPDQVLTAITQEGSTRRIPGTRPVSLRR